VMVEKVLVYAIFYFSGFLIGVFLTTWFGYILSGRWLWEKEKEAEKQAGEKK